MPQTHDLMINGAGYMLVPGTYHYENVGAEVSRFSTGVPAFDQRLGRSATLPQSADKDAKRWTAVGMIPSPIGLGDEPGRLLLAPRELVFAIGAAFDTNSRMQIFNGVVYLTLQQNLYKIALSSGAFSTITFIGAAVGTITSMCVSDGLLFMATTGA